MNDDKMIIIGTAMTKSELKSFKRKWKKALKSDKSRRQILTESEFNKSMYKQLMKAK